jgi:predicted nucleic acid-binding protein
MSRKVFVDANVLVAVANKEYPVFSHAARVLSLAGQGRVELCTSALCLAITFYFASKKSGRAKAKEKIELLYQRLQLAPILPDMVGKALADRSFPDFEDGMQYYAALQSGCTVVVTEDTKGFYGGGLEVLNSEQFLVKYIF